MTGVVSQLWRLGKVLSLAYTWNRQGNRLTARETYKDICHRVCILQTRLTFWTCDHKRRGCIHNRQRAYPVSEQDWDGDSASLQRNSASPPYHTSSHFLPPHTCLSTGASAFRSVLQPLYRFRKLSTLLDLFNSPRNDCRLSLSSELPAE